MTKTVTSLFHDRSAASAIVSRLEQAGLSRSDVTVYSDASDNVSDALEGAGVPRSDAHAYAEGVRRGRSLIAVRCEDDEVDRVISILDGDGALDLDEQQNSWRSEGWQGMTGSIASLGQGSTEDRSLSTGGTGGMTGMSGRDEVIPIAEEELHVGKREVSHGRVRIHSHVVERPVQEQVTLRDETLEVERRPVSGGARTGSVSGDPFQERTIEVEEHDEEAVVSKEARVKEELVVRKDVEQRTETISDTVRSTEVDVEDDRDGRLTGTSGSPERKR
ncbi:YsnF/AvaK domain-containing protein [Microvirga lenta]|uniref:YsnF/AvaK domain-containing protein n=1 Tax=Microvirga lenta TaxID=2881337 RepID=UPI001CFF90B8|nr:YsnF/AvaK domain-containing protein [Microvirga lenta]MCB5175849.1 YsnF/AvaK domain-containing protein [Microvirga lenta]